MRHSHGPATWVHAAGPDGIGTAAWAPAFRSLPVRFLRSPETLPAEAQLELVRSRDIHRHKTALNIIADLQKTRCLALRLPHFTVSTTTTISMTMIPAVSARAR